MRRTLRESHQASLPGASIAVQTNTKEKQVATEPQFKVGDRVFSHYEMRWGTIEQVKETLRDQKHGVTGSELPDTTWYRVRFDDGSRSFMDDAHGNWHMARIVPPRVAKHYGYGDDPNATA